MLPKGASLTVKKPSYWIKLTLKEISNGNRPKLNYNLVATVKKSLTDLIGAISGVGIYIQQKSHQIEKM